MNQPKTRWVFIVCILGFSLAASPCRSRLLKSSNHTDPGGGHVCGYSGHLQHAKDLTEIKEQALAEEAQGTNGKYLKYTQDGRSLEAVKTPTNKKSPQQHVSVKAEKSLRDKYFKNRRGGGQGSKHRKRSENQKQSFFNNPKPSLMKRSKGASHGRDDFDIPPFHVDYSPPKVHPPRNN